MLDTVLTFGIIGQKIEEHGVLKQMIKIFVMVRFWKAMDGIRIL